VVVVFSILSALMASVGGDSDATEVTGASDGVGTVKTVVLMGDGIGAG